MAIRFSVSRLRRLESMRIPAGMRRYRIVPEDPAHVMEQLVAASMTDGSTELVEAVEEELSVLVALGG